MGSDDSKTAADLPLCFVVDDEAAIGRLLGNALKDCGLATEQFGDAASLTAGLDRRLPDLIFLDIALCGSDAVDVIRELGTRRFAGGVQLMSGSDTHLLDDVRRVGERHGLRMRPTLQKPFRMTAVREVVEAEGLTSRTRPEPVARPAEAGAPASSTRTAEQVDLGEALDRGWVGLWYQPKIDLRQKTVTGAEALARVCHPEHGIMLPGSFIPGAGSANLIRLAEQALKLALRDAAEFARAGADLKIAINMPVEALFALPIPAIVRQHRPDAASWRGIIIEITEDQVMHDIERAHEIATQLRIYRIALAIDDFGQGYSSLARLKELPFAELKLDRSFVDGCGKDRSNAAICRAAVELAHRFGSVAVAEGIERTDDLATLVGAGCDVAQGFLFARALPKALFLSRMALHGPDGGFVAPLATAA